MRLDDLPLDINPVFSCLGSKLLLLLLLFLLLLLLLLLFGTNSTCFGIFVSTFFTEQRLLL